jgi:hypothetical protein
VRVANVAGRVINPNGSASGGGTVMLFPDGALARGGQFGLNYVSRIARDGAFQINNVPGGRYVLRARNSDNDQPQFATIPLTVAEEDISNLAVLLTPGASISGTLVFPGSQQMPDTSSMRIAASSTEQQIGAQSQARVQKDFTYSIDGIPPGPYLIRPSGNLRGWSLKSIVADGRDVSDTPIELRSGQQLGHVVITFTSTTTEINGAVTNEQKLPVTDYTVLAFSTDPTYWRPQSRHIATARPDQTGAYRIGGLPAGDYYVTVVDPAEQGEWFSAAYLDEHRIGANHVSLADGDKKTQDFSVRTGK